MVLFRGHHILLLAGQPGVEVEADRQDRPSMLVHAVLYTTGVSRVRQGCRCAVPCTGPSRRLAGVISSTRFQGVVSLLLVVLLCVAELWCKTCFQRIPFHSVRDPPPFWHPLAGMFTSSVVHQCSVHTDTWGLCSLVTGGAAVCLLPGHGTLIPATEAAGSTASPIRFTVSCTQANVRPQGRSREVRHVV